MTMLIPFANDLVNATTSRKIYVFVTDAPSAVCLLNTLGVETPCRHSAPIFRDQLRRAERKGQVAALRTIADGVRGR